MSPFFKYSARTQEGGAVEGEVNAENRENVARKLREQDLIVISVEKIEEDSKGLLDRDIDLSKIAFWEKGFNTAQLAHFSKQFSVLIAAGIPLVQALKIMREQIEGQEVKEMLDELRSTVEAGSSFSEALENHPEYFPELFVHLVKAGETGGVLDEVLEELAEYYKRRDRINKEVKGALYYPAAIIVVAIIAVIILITFVLPTITEMLVDLGGELPLITRALIGTSEFLQSYWWLILGGLTLVIFAMRYLFQTPRGKRAKDRMILKIPVIGDLIKKIIISRFANTLALLLDSGVNIVNALPVIENVVGNVVISEVLTDARASIREGANLSQSLKGSEYFPPIVIQMIQVGEETGNMDEMLNRLSEYYDVEVENAIEGGISLIEPAIIVVMAVVVGGIILSVILPLFDIYQQF